MIGVVVKSTGSWYDVRTEDGEHLSCRLKGKFKLDDKKITNPIAVGDKVKIEKEATGDGTWVIAGIEPRQNYIVRKAIKKTEHSHILASNIDQAVLIATLALPRTSLGFIDRFLVTAETYRIPALLIWNKQDQMKSKDLKKFESYRSTYESIGYPVELISALDQTQVNKLKPLFENKTSLIAGHSGVGKSTLLNNLIPDLNQKTAEVSKFANKGVHTTTFAEMFAINEKSFVIDTPGIKELGLSEIYDEELGHYFPEMRELLGECKFHNCTHIHEPYCAVHEAVNNGDISESRYISYLSMFKEEESHR
ncbi:MAG: ribosome small subunit-dependent GTPase A [Cyclobacteriaceae bacterium]